MSEEISILLSGPGLIGRKHASLIRDNPNTCLGAIVAPSHPNNIEYAASVGVPRYNTIEEALEEAVIDAAIISSPNEFHFEQAITCIENRIPALVEKPLTANLEDAAKLTEAAESEGVALLVGHHRTYSPLLSVACEFINSNEFGRPVALQGAALFYKPKDYFKAGPWRTKIGGGPILINLIHEIGIMRFLFGKIESVTAHTSSATRSFEVEDSAAITFRFANGAVGTFVLSDTSASSKSWEMTAGENPAYPHFPDQNCYHFAGTMGSLDFPSMRCRTYLDRAEKSWWAPFTERLLSFTPQDPLEPQLKHFVEVIRGQAEPMVTARDGYLNMLVVEAIREAAKTGQRVNVSDIANG